MPTRTAEIAFHHTNLPNESHEYRARREELRLAEVELMRHCERVAVLRRKLPEGPEIQDYTFLEGPRDLDAGDGPVTTIRLSELFTDTGRPLVIYEMMFGKRQKGPCPMCTSFVDDFNALAIHLEQNFDLAVVVAAPPAEMRAHARTRGWKNLRLLSAGDSTFRYDLGTEDRQGNQCDGIAVFTRANDGKVHHFYSTHATMSPEIKMRGLDLLNPIWNFLDLTPKGRGDFNAKLEYPPKKK
jgi:predicted dithiol-disulfide oxidoreductase (DUF899 family)